ncbi:MAG: sugar phosphate isomerase/epimerase [Nitrososphaerota archaeon]|nr:sugar phosphate isomerase/epimerase [Nitrososphaerota archaeon]
MGCVLKIGLSTWSLLRLDVCSAVKAIGDAGFEFVELWGEVPHAFPGWADKRRLKDALSTYDMMVTAHAPFTDLNLASPFQPVKGAVERALENYVEFSAYLGASVVTVHPGSVHNEKLVPDSAASSASALRKMVRAARGRLTVSIENQARGSPPYEFPLASTRESLELLLAETPGTRCTLDVGHAYVSGLSPLKMAERVGRKLSEVHLSDNDGRADDHLIPGEGTAPLTPLLEMLSDKDVLVCLELNPHRYSDAKVLAAAGSLRATVGLGARSRKKGIPAPR